MTPDKARDLLAGTTPGPWKVDESDHHVWAIGPIDGSANGSELCCQITDARLAAHAPTLADMIAGMHEEWGVAVTYPGLAEVVEWGFCTRDGAEAEGNALDTEYRIVRRYVTEPEAADATD